MALPSNVIPVESSAAFTYPATNGVPYWAVTEWNAVQCAATNRTFLGSATRILMGEDSTDGHYHLLAQYSFYEYGTSETTWHLYRSIGSRVSDTNFVNASSLGTNTFYTDKTKTVRILNYNWNATGLRETNYPYMVEDLGFVDGYEQTKSSSSFYCTIYPTGETAKDAISSATYTTPSQPPQPTGTIYNKVVINGDTIIDISSDTVAEDKLLSGYTAHDKNGILITGTYEGGDVICTESSGGVSLDQYNLTTNSSTWPANGGWGWREEKWSDGRLTLYWWKWFSTPTSGWNHSWTNLAYPTDATPFVDIPMPQATLFFHGNNVSGSAMIVLTSLKTDSNTTGFKLTYYNSSAQSNAQTLVMIRADGHWQTS